MPRHLLAGGGATPAHSLRGAGGVARGSRGGGRGSLVDSLAAKTAAAALYTMDGRGRQRRLGEEKKNEGGPGRPKIFGPVVPKRLARQGGTH